MLRCFEDDDITHVENRIDPLADAEVVETELMLADLESLEKRITAIEKKAKAGDKEAKAQFAVMEKALIRCAKASPRAWPTSRPRRGRSSWRCSCDLQAGALRLQRRGSRRRQRQRLFRSGRGAREGRRRVCVIISAKIEAEFAGLPPADRSEFLAEMGLTEPGLNRLIRAGYQLLDLVTYFTVGPKEARAWTITRGTKGPQAAGVIHTRLREGLHPRRDHRL